MIGFKEETNIVQSTFHGVFVCFIILLFVDLSAKFGDLKVRL